MTARIIVGDVRDQLAAVPDASVDLILADPPYAETALEWDRWPEGWAEALLRVLKPSGSMWCFGSFKMFWRHQASFRGWTVAQEVVWEKHNGSNSLTDRFRRVHELAVQFYPSTARWDAIYKQPVYTNDATARQVRRKTKAAHWSKINAGYYESVDGGPRLERSVIYERSEHGRAIHPTQKPVRVVELLARYSCPPGGTILSPFFGSGTDGVAAGLIPADCIGFEIDADMAELAAQRLNAQCPLFAEAAA